MLLLLLASPAAAQTAPNRAAEVERIARQHPEAFQCPTDPDPCKLALLPTIVRALNALDGGAWGLLMKTDQQNKIPADVIVWRPTMEHFDVLSDTGPMWGPSGVVPNPRWMWYAVEGSPVPSPGPSPQPMPMPPVLTDLTPIKAWLEASELRIIQTVAANGDRSYAQGEQSNNDGVARDGQLAAKLTEIDAKVQKVLDRPSGMSSLLTNRTFWEIVAGLGGAITAMQVAK